MSDELAAAAANCSPNRHWKTCSLCNYDTHDCPGCGAPTKHAKDNQREVCAECSNRVAADELAEAEANVRIAAEHGEVPGLDWSLPILLAEYDRLREQNFALNAALHAQCDSFEDPAALRADLARALPVVEAAGAVVEHLDECDRNGYLDFVKEAELLDALARAYRAAREPRTGEQK